MYRLFSILFITLISFCAVAQTDSIQLGAVPKNKVDSSSHGNYKSTLKLQGNETPEELLKMASVYYSKGSYSSAVELYEKILAQFGESDKLYYNLGNAYYKANSLAPAILNYERALRLNPGDRDIRFNLEMCQARIVDKINPLGMFLITRWYRSLGSNFGSNTWASISLFFFVLFVFCLFIYFFARISWLKKIGFFLGILSFSLSLLSLVYSGKQYHQIQNPNTAILFTPTVTVKSSPDQSGTDLFVLHEGSKVTILSVLGTWSEIQLENGDIGWLETKDLQII